MVCTRAIRFEWCRQKLQKYWSEFQFVWRMTHGIRCSPPVHIRFNSIRRRVVLRWSSPGAWNRRAWAWTLKHFFLFPSKINRSVYVSVTSPMRKTLPVWNYSGGLIDFGGKWVGKCVLPAPVIYRRCSGEKIQFTCFICVLVGCGNYGRVIFWEIGGEVMFACCPAAKMIGRSRLNSMTQDRRRWAFSFRCFLASNETRTHRVWNSAHPNSSFDR